MDFNRDVERKLWFVLIFAALVLIGSRINFSTLVGAPNQAFTFFQFFGPITGGFLGAGLGVAAVLVAQLADFVLQGKAIEPVNIIRLLPMFFAAYYFASYKSDKQFSRIFMILVPIAAMLLFWSHPVGAAAWYFPLIFWTIPIVVALLPTQNLLLRSLGATMTAHAIGGSLWNYVVPMTPEMWAALIPVVIYERFVFALGISVSYLAINYALDKFTASAKAGFPHVDKRYVISA
ncbi:MAG: hypothetical protein Q7T16_06765 [Candidatus Burarchaeum sp.]|nr:hypothetical protein [Candidatus Burarchaeum sp.]MDO8340330.1 hypothetical protein [Candidatus Burarchaeum sp.]